MAGVYNRLPGDSTTLASFKGWAEPISQMFAAWGWVQTTDVGQVNWSSIASVPTAGNGVYELWRMNDALQASNPVVVKLEYWNLGHSTGTVDYPTLYITVGSGSNGAGGILTPLSRFAGLTANNLGVATVENSDCYFNGGSNWFAMILWRSSSFTGWPMLFALERSKDDNGNDTGDYVTFLGAGNNSTIQSTLMKSGYGANPSAEPNRWWVTLLSHNSSSVWGNNVGCSPVYPWVGKADNPMTCVMVGAPGDFSEGGIVNTSLYGQTHKYLFTKMTYIGSVMGSTSSAAVGIRWD